MNTTTSQNKISSTQAQRLMYDLTSLAMKQIDRAASAKASPRDRMRARARVERAIAALSPTTK